MRRIRNAAALVFFVGLVLVMNAVPETQYQGCTAGWRRCANGTCVDPVVQEGGIPSCETLCRRDQSSGGCCSGTGETIEPTIGCANPGFECQGNPYNELVVFKNCRCAGTCTKRDDDGDGYSPDDSPPYWDCDDTSRFINPGIIPSCSYPGDTNCNGIDDTYDCPSPILVDVAGDGLVLSDASGGVRFDLNGDGSAEQLSWTLRGSDDSWLVLDRNQNGEVDGGHELFGNLTPQPPSETPNGFTALAAFDRMEAGGNGDGWIGAADSVFAELRLWRDENHDGVAEPSELQTLRDAGISAISTQYRDSGRIDRWGNRFRYRAKVQNAEGRHVGQWAYDVFLIASAPPGQAR